MRRWLFVLLLLLGSARSAEAAPPAPLTPPAVEPKSACARESSVLGATACALGSALAASAEGAVVIALGAGQTPLPDALRTRVVDLLVARLGPSARGVHEPLALADAQKRARPRALVYVTLKLQRDHLEASADVYAARGHFWQRLRQPELPVVAHAFDLRPLDPELRALFPPIPLVVTRVDKAKTPDRDAVALACGDLDGDGSSELVLVTRRRIATGRLEHGQFATLAQASWSELSKIAPSPAREPIATAWLAAPGHLRVGLSDRADGLELGASLAVAARFHGQLPWPGGGCALRGELALKGQPAACSGDASPAAVDFAGDVDTVAGERIATQGGPSALSAARPVGSSVAKVWYRSRFVDVPDAGAKLVVQDLDGDGDPEIITTSPSLERKDDALVVRTLDASGGLRMRWRLPVPTGIDAIAACPGDGRAMAPLALASGDVIWVVQ